MARSVRYPIIQMRRRLLWLTVEPRLFHAVLHHHGEKDEMCISLYIYSVSLSDVFHKQGTNAQDALPSTKSTSPRGISHVCCCENGFVKAPYAWLSYCVPLCFISPRYAGCCVQLGLEGKKNKVEVSD